MFLLLARISMHSLRVIQSQCFWRSTLHLWLCAVSWDRRLYLDLARWIPQAFLLLLNFALHTWRIFDSTGWWTCKWPLVVVRNALACRLSFVILLSILTAAICVVGCCGRCPSPLFARRCLRISIILDDGQLLLRISLLTTSCLIVWVWKSRSLVEPCSLVCATGVVAWLDDVRGWRAANR